MVRRSFDFGEVLGFGWAVMKNNFWFFVGLGLVFTGVTILPDIAGAVLKNLYLPKLLYLILAVLLEIMGGIINIALAIGLIKVSLGFCDGKKRRIRTLFDVRGCFWRYVGGATLYGLIIMGGFFLLIIPGIIWSIKFSLYSYFVIDQGLGPVEALRASGRATMGAKWRLFGFGIICAMINVLGILCFVFGIFATYPTVLVAAAIVYRLLAGQSTEPGSGGISEPDIQPGPSDQASLGLRLGLDTAGGPESHINIRPEPVTEPRITEQRPEKKKSSFLLLFVVLVVAIAVAAGVGYYFWGSAKGVCQQQLKKPLLALERLSLTGVLYVEDEPLAIVNGKIVRKGDIISGAEVIEIHKDGVEFERDDKSWTLKVQKPLAGTGRQVICD